MTHLGLPLVLDEVALEPGSHFGLHDVDRWKDVKSWQCSMVSEGSGGG